MKDWQLLQQWVAHRSETAFAQLVDRHIDFVHNCARRQVGDSTLAQDVTQAVFLLLSRKAPSLGESVILTSWLFRTTRFIAARAQRAEYRRLRLETSSIAMQSPQEATSTTEPTVNWSDLEPHLDTAIAGLPGADRDAILLRFFERKPFKEVATTLGVSEDAAKKRVTRAIAKLREGLASRGIALSVAGLGALLAEPRLQAATQDLARLVTGTATGSMVSSTPLESLVQGGARDWLWQGATKKLPWALGAAALIVGGTVLWSQFSSPTHSERSLATGPLPELASTPPSLSLAPSADSFSRLTESSLQLQVVDGATGLALRDARARIAVWGPGGSLPIEERSVDANGTLQIAVTPPNFETLGVSIALEGYVPTLAEWRAHEFVEPVLKHTYRLKRGLIVRGEVHDEVGKPVANATVSLAGFWSFEPSQRENLGFSDSFTAVVTDAQGRFETGQVPNPLPPSGGFILSVSHSDFVRGTLEIQTLDQLATNQVITLKPGVFLSGTVQDDHGNPIMDAVVAENHRHIGSHRSVRTDASGSYRIGPFAAGRVPLEVSAAGFETAAKDLAVPGQTETQEWTLLRSQEPRKSGNESESPAVRIAGSVVDAVSGMPLPEFKVTLAMHPEGQLCRLLGMGHDGRFGWEVNLGMRSPVTVRVEADGYTAAESEALNATSLDAPLSFHMRRTPDIRGRILQPDGRPAGGAEVSLNGDGYGVSFELPARFVNYGPIVPHVLANAEGVFELKPGANPRMVLFVHSSGCIALPVESVTNVLVRLEPWGSLDGLLQVAGKPAPNESIQISRLMPDAMHPPMGVHLTEQTDASGRFIFRRVPPGQYVVSRLIDPHLGRAGETGQSHELRADVQPNRTTTVTLGSEGRPVIARLTTANPVSNLNWSHVLPRLERTPAQPAPVRDDFPNEAAYQRATALYQGFISKHYGTVTPDGYFRAEDVPAGEYTLHVMLFENAVEAAYINGDSWAFPKIVGMASRQVHVPGEPGRRNEIPVDLGDVIVEKRR